ncbi:MAG: hypothetical protein AAFP82_00680, partial [Bacteroidota bacterium]
GHQWWGGQVIPADSPGAKMVVESMAEYVNVQVKRHYKGKERMLNYIRHAQDGYLKGRSRKRDKEHPLMYTRPSQNYIHYPKGALALYAMSEHIGEDQLNAALQKYVEAVAFQEESYTTSAEMLDFIRAATPDSLQYLIEDWFETITFYDNEMLAVKTKELDNGDFETSVTFNIQKYRTDGDGHISYAGTKNDSLNYEKLHSLPLSDYIEIGVLDENRKVVQVGRHLIQSIHNQIVIQTNFRPSSIKIDPNYLLIDKEREDDFLAIH